MINSRISSFRDIPSVVAILSRNCWRNFKCFLFGEAYYGIWNEQGESVLVFARSKSHAEKKTRKAGGDCIRVYRPDSAEDITKGEYVQWLSSEGYMWEDTRRVARIEYYDRKAFAFVDGSMTAIPLDELVKEIHDMSIQVGDLVRWSVDGMRWRTPQRVEKTFMKRGVPHALVLGEELPFNELEKDG